MTLSPKTRETVIGCSFIVAMFIWPHAYQALLLVCIVWGFLKPEIRKNEHVE